MCAASFGVKATANMLFVIERLIDVLSSILIVSGNVDQPPLAPGIGIALGLSAPMQPVSGAVDEVESPADTTPTDARAVEI